MKVFNSGEIYSTSYYSTVIYNNSSVFKTLFDLFTKINSVNVSYINNIVILLVFIIYIVLIFIFNRFSGSSCELNTAKIKILQLQY